MLCGLFFCVLCVSAVYYLWAISEVIRYRESVQDAADTAAFSGAVVHAHGMNLLAFFNMVMAALLAILVALRLVQLLCWFAIGAITAVGWMTGGALYSTIPPIQQVANTMDNLAERLEDPIHKTIEVIHKVGDGVAKVTPIAAAGRTVQLSMQAYKRDVVFATSIPLELELPVESDAFDVLCEHAGEYAGKMAMFPLDPIIPDKVSDAVANALSKLTKAGSGWFCGEEGASPPSLTQDSTRKISRPTSPLRDRCLDTDRKGPAEGELDEVCLEAALYELDSQPDMRGECRKGQPACPSTCAASPERCPPTGTACQDELDDRAMLSAARRPVSDCDPLEWRYEGARRQCAPRSAGGPKGLKGVWWLQQELTRTYVFDGSQYQLVEEQKVGPAEVVKRKADQGGHPCGADGLVGTGYEEKQGAVCKSQAVCETPPSTLPCGRVPTAGRRFIERLTQVQEMVHCIEEQTVKKEERQQQAEAVDVRPKGDDDEDLAPFRLKKDLWLGDDELQVRAVALGEGPQEKPMRGVELASWGRKVDNVLVDGATAVVELFGVAQGEYYFHRSGAPLQMGSEADFLWKMAWRARLRPLHLDGGSLCNLDSGKTRTGKWSQGLINTCKEVDQVLSGDLGEVLQ